MTCAKRHGSTLEVDTDFLSQYTGARYATIVALRHVRLIDPVRFTKTDRRAWVTLTEPLVATANCDTPTTYTTP